MNWLKEKIRMRMFYKKLRYSVFVLFENYDEISEIAKKLFLACKDSSVDEIKNDFIQALASVVHENNKGEE